MTWKTIERPGYFGKQRDALIARWNAEHGHGQWRLAWEFGTTTLDRDLALAVYTDGFFEHARTHPDIVDWLCKYQDVYDTAPSNVAAGCSFLVQETPSSHLHDVAWRRVLARLGRSFSGEIPRLLHIRWTDSEGYRLNPGVVPFHRPDLIASEPIQDYGAKGTWWYPGTVEDFYQRNKLLQVRTCESSGYPAVRRTATQFS